MTIAVGFRSNEGIVLCADTEIMLGNTWVKDYEGKMVTSVYTGGKFAICIAGAGETDYIRTATETLHEGLSDCENLSGIRTHLKSKLIGFFDGHLANWAYFPQAERPSVDLLIGVSTKAGPFELFYYGGTAFYSIRDKPIGSGVVVASNLTSEYRSFGEESLDDLCRLAIFVVRRAKKQVVGCGGNTHLVALKRGGDFAFPESDAEVERLEEEIATTSTNSKRRFVSEMHKCTPIRLVWLMDFAHRMKPKDEPST